MESWIDENWEEGNESHGDFLSYVLKDMVNISWRKQLDLVRLAQDGNAQARKLLIKSCFGLILQRVKRFCPSKQDFGDLFNEGVIGLDRAIDRFDLKMSGIKFSTYAVYWIDQTIQRSIITNGRLIKLPDFVAQSAHKIEEAINVIEEELGRPPTDNEAALKTGYTTDTIAAFRATAHVSSLDSYRLDQDGCGDSAYNLIDDTDPHAELEIGEFAAEVLMICEQLPLRYAQVLEMRFGLRDGIAMSLDQIGEIMEGLSRERIRQIEKVAFQKFREIAESLNNLMIWPYIENLKEKL